MECQKGNDVSALSTKDKLRLRISKERVARWNALREQWANESVDKRSNLTKTGKLRHGGYIVTGGTKWKQPETLRPDKMEW